MSQLRIVVEPQFEETKTMIFGIIYFVMEDKFFPAKDWTDFPIILCNDWLKEIERLKQIGGTGQLSFLDGPYHISISTNRLTSIWELQFIRDRWKAYDVIYTLNIHFDLVRQAIIETSQEVVKSCNTHLDC